MKKIVLPLALALMLLSGCAQMAGYGGTQTVNAKNVQSLHQREWELRGLTFQGQPIVLDLDTKITIRFGADGQVSGSAAVNRISGTYQLSADGKLSWGKGGLATTRMAGLPELMEKEKVYLSALAKVNVAILGGHVLILQSDESGAVLTYGETGY